MAKKQQPTGENNFNNWSYDASFDNEARDTRIGDAIADAFSSDNPYMALLDIATMGTFGGVGGKGMVKNFLTKSAKGRKLVEKLPFLAKLTEKIVSPKNKGFDFQKGFSDGLKARGGVTNNYSSLPSNVAQHNKAIDAFDNYRKGVKTKFKNKVSEAYEKIGKTVEPRYFESPQNMMDQFSLKERLNYLSKNKIKDDWLFSGGVTKKGGKYFDVGGIEIPLDPKVSYTPPNLRKNIK